MSHNNKDLVMGKLKLLLLKIFLGNPEKIIAKLVEEGDKYVDKNTDDWAAFVVSKHSKEYQTTELISAYKWLFEAFISVIKTYRQIKLPQITEFVKDKLN